MVSLLCDSSIHTSTASTSVYSMFGYLWKTLLVLYSYPFFNACDAFHIPSKTHDGRNQLTVSATVHCTRLMRHQKNKIFVLSATDSNKDETKVKKSKRMSKLFRRLVSICKYPIAIVWNQRHRFGNNDIVGANATTAPLMVNCVSDIDVPVTSVDTAMLTIKAGNSIFSVKCLDRSVHSAHDVNLTGSWNIIISNEFLKEYDLYLQQLGQPYIVRAVALNIIGRTSEETIQSENGRSLLIRSINAKGVWERTLIASGMANMEERLQDTIDCFTPIDTTVWTADNERVNADAWWENNGTIHHSWLRGVTKYGGGDFESIRYLEDEGSTLICESIFHPSNVRRQDVARIRWCFSRRIEEVI
jgi:hypothetical protein